MDEFSDQTAACLARSGWTKGSSIDVARYEAALTAAGFTLHNAALEFLGKYGGFHVHYPHAKVAHIVDEMHFDPLITIEHIRPAAIDDYRQTVGKQLCPIGEAARGYLILMMDEAGAVYGSYDDFFARIGSSGADAIEALCSGREMTPISSAVRYEQFGFATRLSVSDGASPGQRLSIARANPLSLSSFINNSL